MTDPTPTDTDLARLLTFATLHDGSLVDIPHGSVHETYGRLAAAGLVTIDHDIERYPQLPVTITPRGREVAAAMLQAGRSAMNSAT